MTEYIAGVVAVSILASLASFFSYGGASERAVRAAIAMILIYTVCVPAIRLFADASPDDISLDISADCELSDGEYTRVAEAAFCDGISSYISEKFHLNKEEIAVAAYGFEFEKMRAERISVTLRGRAALSDCTRIADAVSKTGIGECEVNIKIG